MVKRFVFETVIAVLATIQVASATPGQCGDTVDNDGDGSIDYLRELKPDNGEEISLGGGGDPFQVMQSVRQQILAKKLPIALPTTPLLRSFGGSGYGSQWFGTGSFDTPTLQRVCRILGYATVVSSTCRDSERSWRYPAGKCNFHSPHDNYLFAFNGLTFAPQTAQYKYQKTWVASISCKDRLAACNDGWDNDGDGMTDFPIDPGCVSANDDDEQPHDLGCDSLDDPSESEECQDGIDNDGDGLIDLYDPGCPEPRHNKERDEPTPTPTVTPTQTPTATRTRCPTHTPTLTPSPFATLVLPEAPKPTKAPTCTPTPGHLTPEVIATSTATPAPLCKAWGQEGEDERLSSLLINQYFLGMRLIRGYSRLLHGSIGDDRCFLADSRSQLKACADKQDQALGELLKSGWFCDVDDGCEKSDISKQLKILGSCAKKIRRIQEDVLSAQESGGVVEAAKARTLRLQADRMYKEIKKLLKSAPSLVSVCK
jgi:hypothetical protein